MYQRPIIVTGPQYDMASLTTVTAIRSAFCNVFFPVVVGGTRTAVTGAAIYLYIIYEIAFRHTVYL